VNFDTKDKILDAINYQINAFKPLDPVRLVDAFVNFIPPAPPMDLSKIINDRFNELCSGLDTLRKSGALHTFTRVQDRLRKYFEFSGNYEQGIRFGNNYAETIGTHDLHAMHWTQIYLIAYLSILANKHDEGRKVLKIIIKSLNSSIQTTGDLDIVMEQLFYCHRYCGISHHRSKYSKNLAQARVDFTEAKRIANSYAGNKERKEDLEARIGLNIGNLFLEEGNFLLAIEQYERSKKIFTDRSDVEHIGICDEKIAAAIIGEGKHLDNSAMLLQNAENVYIDIAWVEGQGRVAELYAQLYLKRNEIQRALDAARHAQFLFNKVKERGGDDRSTVRITELISRLNHLLGGQ
jgi:tetratricopeptide (TPR) repeat protein